MEKGSPLPNLNSDDPPWKHIVWHAPPNRSALHAIPHFSADWTEDTTSLIEEIDALKESIQPYDNTDTWDLAKRITNPYELIYTSSSRLSLPKSTSCLQPLSRSFFKLTEMLQILDFFGRHKQPKLRSLHVCEGPGGFIESFLSEAETHKKLVSVSHAMTLKSTHHMIPGWRRATQFLQKHKQITLLYGPSRSGDIYERENQEVCVEAAKTNSLGATLVTGDGGFDFSEDFYAQEKSMFRLLVCSAVILLQGVAQEGDFVLKLFDIQSPATRDLLTLLAACFQQWTLYKPATSRPCNSEWYFLGRGAISPPARKPFVDSLCRVRDWLETQDTIRQIWTSNPLESLLRTLQEERMQRQIIALKRVLTFCHEPIDKITLDTLWAHQRIPCIQWCYTFRIPTNFRLKDFTSEGGKV